MSVCQIVLLMDYFCFVFHIDFELAWRERCLKLDSSLGCGQGICAEFSHEEQIQKWIFSGSTVSSVVASSKCGVFVYN